MPDRWVIKPGTNTVTRWDGLSVDPGDLLVMPVGEHYAFVEDLTIALMEHDVPAMPTWREAIDWLAREPAFDEEGGGKA